MTQCHTPQRVIQRQPSKREFSRRRGGADAVIGCATRSPICPRGSPPWSRPRSGSGSISPTRTALSRSGVPSPANSAQINPLPSITPHAAGPMIPSGRRSCPEIYTSLTDATCAGLIRLDPVFLIGHAACDRRKTGIPDRVRAQRVNLGGVRLLDQGQAKVRSFDRSHFEATLSTRSRRYRPYPVFAMASPLRRRVSAVSQPCV